MTYVSKPGIHCQVCEESNIHLDYVVFPDMPELRQVFRHAWVLHRSPRPFVPQPDGTPMPDHAKTRGSQLAPFSLFETLGIVGKPCMQARPAYQLFGCRGFCNEGDRHQSSLDAR